MSLRSQLRKLLDRFLDTPSVIEEFLIDYFKEEVPDRGPALPAEGGAVDDLLAQVSPERIREALEDWAERNDQTSALLQGLAETEPGRRPGGSRPGAGRGRDGLLERVRAACELRERRYSSKGLTLRRITPRGPLCVFHVHYADNGFPTCYALGVTEQPPAESVLDAFLSVVRQRQLPLGYALPSVLVHAGERPDAAVRAAAVRRNIKLWSIDEYELLLDNLPEAMAAQTARLEQNEPYASALYVAQRGELSMGSSFRFGAPEEPMLERLVEMLRGDEAQFVLILGEFGLGKTFLMYELVRALARTGGAPWPVLCELRHIEKKQSLDALLAWQLQESGIRPIDPASFRHLVRLGKIVLFFDGFDELALRTTYDRAAEHLETLLGAVEGRAKVVLTSRTQHFQHDRQLKTALAERLERVPARVVRLLKFTEPQIQQYLDKRLGPRAAARRYKLIKQVKDLLGLSENPRMLGFIAGLDESRLLEVKRQAGHISAAELYRLILDEWLKFEVARVQQAGLGLGREQLLLATTQLAHVLWRRSERSATLDDLEVGAQAALAAVDKARAAGRPAPSEAEATHQVGAGSLLVRDGEGRFSFLHQSVLEWLVASDAAAQLRAQGEDRALDQGEMSPLMAEFFIDLLGNGDGGEPRAVAWAISRLDAETVPSGAQWSKRNALRVAERLKTAVPVLQARKLAGQDLREEDFTARNLSFSDLSGALLQGVSLRQARLRSADLRGARLMDADLRGADLRDADLRGADLSRARLMQADLRGAKLQDAMLQRAKLLGCRMDASALAMLSGPHMLGTAAPADGQIRLYTAPGIALEGCAVSWEAGLVAVAFGRHVGLCDLASGQILRVLSGHQGSVFSVALSRDGRTVASGDDDCTARLWDTASGRCTHVLGGHQGRASSVALSGDGRAMTTGADDATVRVWDAASGQCARVLSGHQSWVDSVALSRDGQAVASGANDGTVRVWDAASGRCTRVLGGHQGRVLSVALSGDGQTAVSGSQDGTVRVWDAAGGRCTHVLGGRYDGDVEALSGVSVVSVALSDDGQTVAAGADDCSVHVWDAASGQCTYLLSGHEGRVLGVALSGDGKTVISGSDDGTVRRWDVAGGQSTCVLSGQENRVLSVALSRDGKTVLSGANDGTVRLWDAASGRCTRVLSGHYGHVWSVALSSDGRTVISGGADCTVRVWDAAGGQSTCVLDVFPFRTSSVALSGDGRIAASGASRGTLRLWDVASGQNTCTLEGSRYHMSSVALSSDGKTVISGATDGLLRVWDAASGQCTHVLSGHEGRVSTVALSGDGRTAASRASDGTVRLWDTAGGRCIGVLGGHPSWVSSMALSGDGQTMVSGANDGTVRLWETASGRCTCVLGGHEGRVSSVSLSRDGQTVVSGSDDGTVRLWDVAAGRCIAILAAGAAGWVALTPDGRYKSGGNPRALAWHAIGLCRYELAITNPDGSLAEPGELDDLVPGLRLAPSQPLRDLPPWSPNPALSAPSATPAQPDPSPGTATEAPEPARPKRPRTASAAKSGKDASAPAAKRAPRRPSAPADQTLFAWLHLSDLHFGHGDAEHGWDQKLVLTALRTDVEQQVRAQAVPAPHALLVTGDIAFSGAVRRPTEYQDAAAYLRALTETLGLTAAQVFLVPGNHDVQRSGDRERELRRLLHLLRAGDELLDDALASDKDAALLAQRQAAYRAFASAFGPAAPPSGPAAAPAFHTRHTLTRGDLKVRLAGLNTALLAADDQDHGRLRLGKGALAQLLTAPVPAPDELVIVLSHHPLGSGWLADEKEAEGWLRRHAHVHLCGHVHEAASEQRRSGSGGELIRITAGAAHGDRAPQGVPSGHGYNFAAVVHTAAGDLVLRTWPRRFSDANKDFRADVDNVAPDRPYAEHLLRLPWPPARG